MAFDEMEAGLRARLESLPPAARAELPPRTAPSRTRPSRTDRAEFWGHPETGTTFGELVIDPEEERATRAVVFGLLREMERK